MIHRPQSTLVQPESYPKDATIKFTQNGAAQAAKELFPCEPMITDPQMDTPVSLGTTIIAVAFEGGVVLAADSRTSTGTYVVNRVSNKLTKLTENVYCCRSGSAADTQALAEMVSNYVEQQSIVSGKRCSVKAAASIFTKLCYTNKWGISAGIIVAGYDSVNGGSVYSIPSGGSCVKLQYALGGSGSVFLYSFFDANYKTGMSKDQCVHFCRTAVSHALSRDGSSGGVVRTICLTAEGAEHTTTPWTKLPYVMERDPNHQVQAQQNAVSGGTSKIGQNQQQT